MSKKGRKGNFSRSNMGSNNLPNGEVFRNFFAVRDDIDPRISLQHIKEMFSGKVDDDVITMIFSECAYDVDQTLESLMAISNDSDPSENINSSESSTQNTQPLVQTASHNDTNYDVLNVQSNLSASAPEWHPNTEIPLLSVANSNEQCRLPMSPKQFVDTSSHEVSLPSYKQKNENHKSPFYHNSNSASLSSSTPYPRLFSSVVKQTPVVTSYASYRTKNTNTSHSTASRKYQFRENAKAKASTPNINDISSKIIDGQSILVLLRGLPGSGKSTLARDLKFSGVVLSTDDYFSRNGKYRFDWTKLQIAHEWNQSRALGAVERGVTPVIIDNTNTELWEMVHYVQIGMQFNYDIYILEPNTPWKFKPGKLARKNSHKVSKEKIEKMLERYDHNITVESLKDYINKRNPKPPPGNSSSEKNNDVCSAEDSNFISHEAVVHREDEKEGLEDKESMSSDDNKDSNETNPSDDMKLQFESLNKIDDINELKLLMQDDSEESVVSSQNQQSSGSSQDVSGWEAITERDDEFLWSGMALGSSSSSVSEVLYEEDEEKLHQNGLFTKKWGDPTENACNEISENPAVMRINETSTEFKPQRENLFTRTLNQTSTNDFNKLSLHVTDDNLWNGTLSWDESPSKYSEENIKTKREITSEPKPCRNGLLFGNRDFVLKHNENHSSSVCGIPLIDSTDNWQLPAYPVDSKSISTPNEKQKPEISYSVHEVQTEPSDFVLLYKIENNPLYISSIKTLASSTNLSVTKNLADQQNSLSNSRISQIAHFDKSTCTEDIPFDVGRSEKINTLRMCFPEILEEDLCHLLDICHGDSSWLSGILLEWGYKYNVPHLSSPELLDSQLVSANEQISLVCETDGIRKLSLDSASFEPPQLDANIQLPKPHEAQNLKLILDAELASKLQQLFGPISQSTSGNLSDSLRTIPIGVDIAKILYDKWKESIDTLFVTEEVGSDIGAVNCYDKKLLTKDSEASCSAFKFSAMPETLSEIMDMEYALQAFQNQKLRNKKIGQQDLAMVLKRKKLYSMFPGVDPIALDNVFDSNNCSLENTLKVLEADIGQPAKEVEEATIAHKVSPLQDIITDNWDAWVHESGEFLSREEAESTTLNPNTTPEAEHWRAEAAMHYQIRRECISKAQSAYCRGMPDVASFYAQKGEFHCTKFKAANKIASELILQNKNKCFDSLVLDLHGLFIQEAIPVLRKFLKNQKEKLAKSSSPAESLTVSVITGRGAHSLRGAKLRPSVMKYLTSTGCRFVEVNLGVFNITLSP